MSFCPLIEFIRRSYCIVGCLSGPSCLCSIEMRFGFRENLKPTVGTSVHVILISLNPISTNPVLNALSETISPTHTDAGDLGGVREGEWLLVSQNGRHYYHCVQTASDHSIQPGEHEHGACFTLSVMSF